MKGTRVVVWQSVYRDGGRWLGIGLPCWRTRSGYRSTVLAGAVRVSVYRVGGRGPGIGLPCWRTHSKKRMVASCP